jgi:hypothetical protein
MHVFKSAFACAWCALLRALGARFSVARPLTCSPSRSNQQTHACPPAPMRTHSLTRALSLPQANLGLRGGGLLVKGTPLSWEDSLQVFLRVRMYVCVCVCIMRTRKHTHVPVHSNREECARLCRCLCACVHLCLSVSKAMPVVSLFIPFFFARCAARSHTHTEKFFRSVCDVYVSTEYCSSFTPTTNSLFLSLSLSFSLSLSLSLSHTHTHSGCHTYASTEYCSSSTHTTNARTAPMKNCSGARSSSTPFSRLTRKRKR